MKFLDRFVNSFWFGLSKGFGNLSERVGLIFWISLLSAPGLLVYSGANFLSVFFFWLFCVCGLSITLGLVDFESRDLKEKLKHLAFEKNRDKIKLAILYKEFELTEVSLKERLDTIENKLKKLEKLNGRL